MMFNYSYYLSQFLFIGSFALFSVPIGAQQTAGAATTADNDIDNSVPLADSIKQALNSPSEAQVQDPGIYYTPVALGMSTQPILACTVSDNRNQQCTCPSGSFAISSQCTGPYCDNVSWYCVQIMDQFQRMYVAVNPDAQYSEETSDEYPPLFCSENKAAVSVQCTGRYCDNVAIKCANLALAQPDGYETHVRMANTVEEGCAWTSWFSDENEGKSCANSWFVRGIECTGRYCDDMRLYCCPSAASIVTIGPLNLDGGEQTPTSEAQSENASAEAQANFEDIPSQSPAAQNPAQSAVQVEDNMAQVTAQTGQNQAQSAVQVEDNMAQVTAQTGQNQAQSTVQVEDGLAQASSQTSGNPVQSGQNQVQSTVQVEDDMAQVTAQTGQNQAQSTVQVEDDLAQASAQTSGNPVQSGQNQAQSTVQVEDDTTQVTAAAGSEVSTDPFANAEPAQVPELS